MDIEPQLSLRPWNARIQLKIPSLSGNLIDAVRQRDGTINRRLLSLLDLNLPSIPIRWYGVKTKDIVVDPSRDLWFRLFTPTQASNNESLPVLVFFHGGGFASLGAGSIGYDVVCRRFSRELSVVVVSVNYRLAPEHKFPSQYDDGFDVLKMIDKSQRDIGFWPKEADVTKCFLIGDSAGGNIAHNVAVRASVANLTDVKIIGLINIQPFFGGNGRLRSEIVLEGAPIVSMARVDWMWKAFLPRGMDMDHWAVNVSGPNAIDISGMEKFPPTMVVVGGFDPLCDWQRRYYQWLKNCGKEAELVEYPKACHAFYVLPELSESWLLMEEIKVFIQNHM